MSGINARTDYELRGKQEQIDYSDFLPIWKEYLHCSEGVMNVQMVAHYFYNLGIKKVSEK